MSSHPSQSAPQPQKKGCSKCFESIKKWLTYQEEGEWLEEMRGMLSLVATVISTMTFQAAINPPGGANDKTGVSVLAHNKDAKERYVYFILFNTICFGGSLVVTVLLVSGIPLKHSFPVWLLSIGMCITITFLGLTYIYGIQLVNPSDAIGGQEYYDAAPWVWGMFMACIALILTIRFVVWLFYSLVKGCIILVRCCFSCAKNTGGCIC